MKSKNLKISSKQNLILLAVVFIFLFFGWQALAAECADYPAGSPNGCTVSITFTDPGGSGLAECKYYQVTPGDCPTNTTWLPAAGTCSGNSATLTATIFVVSPGDYDICWYAEDKAENFDFGRYDPKSPIKIVFPPAAPSNLTGSAFCAGSNNPDISLSWGDNSNNEDGFKLYRGTILDFAPIDANLIAVLPANTTSDTDTTPLAGNTYYYKIKAFNAGGDSDYAASSGISLPADFCKPTFVLIPASATILVGGTQQFDGEYDPDGPGGGAASSLVARTSVVWSSSNFSIATVNTSGLATGQSAGSVNIGGSYSGITAKAELTVKIAPPTVTNSTGASNITSNSARLNGEVTNTGGENPTVHIYWGNNDGGTNPANWDYDENLGKKGAEIFYKDISGLNPNTTYYYRCYASNSGGSDWADSTASFTTPDFSISASPTTIKAPQTGTSQASTITITSFGDFNSAVTLSVPSVLPTGATPNFSPNPVTPPPNGQVASIFKVNTSNVSPGSYALTIQGQGGGIAKTTPLTLKVVDLSVSLTADPPSGTVPLNDVDLIADVGGTAIGTVNFKFHCDAPTSPATWQHSFDGIDVVTTDASPVNRTDTQGHTHSTQILTGEIFKVFDLCDYPSAGSYTSRVKVERDVANPAEATTSITVTCKSAGQTCSVSDECCSGLHCAQDYDGDPAQGGWCEPSTSCAHDGKEYPNGTNAPDCYDTEKRRYCNSGTWADQDCGSEYWQCCNAGCGRQYVDYGCTIGNCWGPIPGACQDCGINTCFNGSCTTNPSYQCGAICLPPASGDWEIDRNCILDTTNGDLIIKEGATLIQTYPGTHTLTLNGNIVIKKSGILELKGKSNITFSGTPRYIYIESGGKLYQSGTAGFNK